MFFRMLSVVLCATVIGACQESPIDSSSPVSPSAVSTPAAAGAITASGPSQAAASAERPWKASVTWAATGIQWAGEPGQATSLFEGRCSVQSDYVITAAFEGNATHAGRVTGSTSHCSQIQWSPQGPTGATYGDGRGVIKSANGSTIVLRYGSGTTGADPATGKLWFRDEWTFTGGTGLFAGATGNGVEGGTFADFGAILSGAPVTMWMEGTITYNPGKGK